MKKIISHTLILLPVLLAGCSVTNTSMTNNQQELDELMEEIQKQKEVIASQEVLISKLDNFSYLHEFTAHEFAAYDLFKKDYDVTHLKDYTAEKIVLLYYHSLSEGDLEAVYAFTYDGGSLPEFSRFSDLFYASDHYLSNNDSIFTYRYYDSIEVREENQTEDRVDVETQVHSGIHQSAEIFEVQKENDQWKLVLQHLL